MKRHTCSNPPRLPAGWAGAAALLVLCCLFIPAQGTGSSVFGQEPPRTAQADTISGTVHTVLKGDTLWDLSAHYLQSPWVWPQVFEANQRTIANPHLIYPGQRIWFSVGGGPPIVLSFEEVWPGPETELAELRRQAVGVAVRQAAENPPEPEVTEEPPVQTETFAASGFSVTERNLVPLATPTVVLGAGFIGEPDDWPEWRIIDGEMADLNMSVYNQVFLDVGEEEARVGNLFLVIERGPRVRHPEWGHYLGRKIEVKGIIRIDDVEGNTSRGELIAVFDAVRRKDQVIPAPIVDSRPWKEFVPVQGGREGFIVALARPHGNLHPYDMLFIDGGAEEGVQVGDLYTIRRPQEERGRLRFFEDELGKAVVLDVQPTTATVMLVELSTAELSVGERVDLIGRSVFVEPPGG